MLGLVWLGLHQEKDSAVYSFVQVQKQVQIGEQTLFLSAVELLSLNAKRAVKCYSSSVKG